MHFNITFVIIPYSNGGNNDGFEIFRYLTGKILTDAKYVANVLNRLSLVTSLISEHLMEMANFTVSAMVRVIRKCRTWKFTKS